MSSTPTSPFNTADKTTPGHYDASRTAILLLDFHTLFINRAGGTAAQSAATVASQLAAWARTQHIAVIHALIDVDATPFPTCKDANRLATTVAAAKASGGLEKEPASLYPDGGSGGGGGGDTDVTFLRRPGYVSALKSPGLEAYLRDRGIVSLVLAGLSTSGCVLRTAMAACDAEFVTTVVEDACADPGEGVHDFVVEKLLQNRGYVVSTDGFIAGFVACHGQ